MCHNSIKGNPKVVIVACDVRKHRDYKLVSRNMFAHLIFFQMIFLKLRSKANRQTTKQQINNTCPIILEILNHERI